MMKKILLTSTALVLATSVASADAPMVKVGGTVDARIASVDQKDLYKNINDAGTALDIGDTHHTESTKMSTEASVTVEAMGKADNGIEYGSEIKFDIDTSVGATTYKDAEENDVTNEYHDGKSVRLHHANVYVKSGMGHVALGGTKSAAHSLKVVAPSIATGGAVNGDWTDYVNMEVGHVVSEAANPAFDITDNVGAAVGDIYDSTLFERAVYLTGDALPGDANTASKYSNKVAFYTPKISGFQAGISYGLDTNNYGGHTGFASKYSTDATHPTGVRNNVSVAATYEHQMNDMLAQFSVAGEFGDTKNEKGATVKFRDVKAFEVGASVCADEFKLGGTYGSWGKSLNLRDLAVAAPTTDVAVQINERNNSKGYFWTLGATYVNGPVSLGANYYASKLQGNKVRTFGLAAEYALAEGLTTYVEANFFKLTPKASGVYQTAAPSAINTPLEDATLATKNDGSVFLLGTKVNF